MKRRKVKKGKSKRMFSKTAGLMHRYNTLNPIQRGGTRL